MPDSKVKSQAFLFSKLINKVRFLVPIALFLLLKKVMNVSNFFISKHLKSNI